MVTDVEWVKQAVKFFSLFGFLMPGEGRVFSTAEADVTSQVSAGSQGRPSASMTRVSKKCLPCFAAVER